MTDEKKEVDKMRIWDQVSKTDVKSTKEVTFGRRFTAIDAHSQIMAATQLFGPVGAGWGYDTVYGIFDTGRGETYVWCDLILWYLTGDYQWEGMPAPGHRNSFGPVRGLACIQGIKADGKHKTSDHDASKKAMTDALTKGLSHLGFNADVFLGKFDDNKYVAGLEKEQEKENSAAELAYQQDRQKFIDKVEVCKKPIEIDAVVKDYNLWMSRLAPGISMEMVAWCEKKKKELTSGS